jgi:hypothetical protein
MSSLIYFRLARDLNVKTHALTENEEKIMVPTYTSLSKKTKKNVKRC